MSDLVVRAEQLWLDFGNGQRVLDAIDLTLRAGEVVGLVGESGSGKTLLGRTLLGLTPQGARVGASTLEVNGIDWLAADEATRRSQRGPGVGLVLQEPLTSLNPALSVGSQLSMALRLHRGLDRAGARLALLDALREVQIPDPEQALDKYPHEFSGGQRQRLMIAAVLALRPRLIIADEPSTALDVLIGEEILDLIVYRARRSGAAVLLISHDLAQVARRADRIVVLERGCIVDQGPASDVLLAPRHPYTRKLLEAVPRRGESTASAPAGDVLISAGKLTLDYPRPRRLFAPRLPPLRAVDAVSFELRRGETLAVIGESGSGKSSLASLVLGLRAPTAGSLQLFGREWSTLTFAEARALRRRVQVVFQDPTASLDPRMRVGEIVAEGLRLAGVAGSERRERAAAALAEVGLEAAFISRYPHQLSGGQRQRVAIARALVVDPEIVIADEAVSALDVTVQAQVLQMLEALKAKRGFALLFITHDLGVVERIADRVIVMRGGRVVESGTRDGVFDAPRDPYTRALLSVAPVLVPEAGGYRLASRQVPTGAPA